MPNQQEVWQLELILKNIENNFIYGDNKSKVFVKSADFYRVQAQVLIVKKHTHMYLYKSCILSYINEKLYMRTCSAALCVYHACPYHYSIVIVYACTYVM